MQKSNCPHCGSISTSIHTLVPVGDDTFDAVRRCNACDRMFMVKYSVEEEYEWIDAVDPIRLTAMITKGMA